MKKHLDFRTLVSRLIVTVVMCLPAWGIPVLAQEAESYAVFDAESATLTFRHDAAKPEGAYALNEGSERPGWSRLPSSIIKKVVFDASFAAARPTTCRSWFSSCSSLKTVEGLANLNTEAVTDMNSMFYYCTSLKSLDLSTFNTANVTDMSGMFFSCDSLTSLNVSGFNTSKVTKMDNMFNTCQQLPALDVSSFNTENVTSMDRMFTYCKKLKTLDLKNFDTRKVTSMDYLFNYCQELTSLDVSGFNTENVKSMDYMFGYCLELLSLDVSNFNTQNVTSMHGMFYFCTKLPSIDVSKFDTRNVKSLSYLFGQCNELASVDVSHFNTQNVTDLSSMFCYCKSLAAVDVTNFDTRNVTDMSGLFNGCNKFTSLDVSNFDTRNVENMNAMFADCSKLTTLDVSNFDTRKVESMQNMFIYCNELTSLDVTNFDTRNTKMMGGMFQDCKKITTLDLSNFNTKQVYNMKYMFSGCRELTTIYATDLFDTSAEIYDFPMFSGCYKLVGAVPFDGSKLNRDMANYTTGYFTQGKSTFGPYVAFDATDGTLTFCHGLKMPAGAYKLNDATTTPGWIADHKEDIKKVVFDGSFAEVKPTSCYQWFAGCTNLATIEDFKNLKTDEVTTMASMFQDCKGLTTLDAKTLNTQKVTDMKDMFAGCSSLTALDVSTFDTQNAERMSGMFAGCEKVTELELSGFSTPKAKDMANMFSGCKGITVLDISKFNTASVEDMSGMFANCPALTTIYAGSEFVVTAVTADAGMFAGCERLVGASVFDEEKTGKEMANYTTGYLSNIAPTEPESYVVMDADQGTMTFRYDTKRPAGAYPLNTGTGIPGWIKVPAGIDVRTVVFDESFANARPTSGHMWFANYYNLETITGIENLNTEEMTDMNQMFYACSSLITLDLTRFNTAKVTDMGDMFGRCRRLTTILASDLFVTTAVKPNDDMFEDCFSLKGAVEYDANKKGLEMADFKGYLTNPNGTGIGNVDASRQGEVEYYDLSGRRLSVPQKGVGIMRTGNQTRKSVVR